MKTIKSFSMKKLSILLILMFLFSLSLTACQLFTPKYINASVSAEAGQEVKATDFLKEEGHSASFSETFLSQYAVDGTVVFHHIGTYAAELIVDGKEYSLSLEITDTVAPKATPVDLILCKGDSISPEQCLFDLEDQTDVTLSFKDAVDTSKKGTVSTFISLVDEGANTVEIPVTVQVMEMQEYLDYKYTIEAGTDIPTTSEVLGNEKESKYITDVSYINTALAGDYEIELEVDGSAYSTTLHVIDTIAPTATITPQSAYHGATFPAAKSFVSDICDAGPVSASYETEPEQSDDDVINVSIVLTDQGGNTTVYESYFNMDYDEEPPVFITFPEKLETRVGETLIWRSNVTAEDNTGEVEINLDTTNVNLNKAGSYKAFFVATDVAGNETKQPVDILVSSDYVTEDMMAEVCQNIVGKIINEDMSVQEQLYAVYRYVINKVRYTSVGTHDDIRKRAYEGLAVTGSGDCFTFCAASKELLDYLGYDTMVIRRAQEYVSASGNHFWLLVNCGTQSEPLWYHFDACPTPLEHNRTTYMMTDAQIAAYSKFASEGKYHVNNYYSYDTTQFPASATEIVVDLNLDAKYYE